MQYLTFYHWSNFKQIWPYLGELWSKKHLEAVKIELSAAMNTHKTWRLGNYKSEINETWSWVCPRRGSHPPSNLDFLCIQQLDTAPFCENYTKLYFDAKCLEKGLNRGWWNFWWPFFLKKTNLLCQCWTLP